MCQFCLFNHEALFAQGIAAEIPQELRSNFEELERKARFLRAPARKNAPVIYLKKQTPMS
jgi:glutaredoxin